MPISEAARHDLYNGLSDLLGHDRADTLMAYLPEFDPKNVATKTDIARIEGNLGDLKSGQALLQSRIDRLFVTLVAGLFVIVAAMASFVFTTL